MRQWCNLAAILAVASMIGIAEAQVAGTRLSRGSGTTPTLNDIACWSDASTLGACTSSANSSALGLATAASVTTVQTNLTSHTSSATAHQLDQLANPTAAITFTLPDTVAFVSNIAGNPTITVKAKSGQTADIFTALDSASAKMLSANPLGVGVGQSNEGNHTVELYNGSSGQTSVALMGNGIASPFTAIAWDTEVGGRLILAAAGVGGAGLEGFTDSNAVAAYMAGYIGNASPTQPALAFYGYKTNGGTGATSLTATQLIAQFLNSNTVIDTILGNGAMMVGAAGAPSGMLTVTGHVHSAGTAPTVSAGGCTSPVVTAVSTDQAGEVNVGTSCAVATITLAFNGTWTNAPFCSANFSSASVVQAIKVAPSATALVLTTALNFTDADKIQYVCMGAE